MKEKVCCFTGHRPEKLGIPEQRLRLLLEDAIRQAIRDGFTTFLTGMAKGVDLVAAEIVLAEREKDPRLKLIAVLPFETFGQRWGGGWAERFREVLAQADRIHCVSQEFSYASYQWRNQYMVDHASMVLAVFNGEHGGTKNTLDYARKRNVPCRIIQPEEQHRS